MDAPGGGRAHHPGQLGLGGPRHLQQAPELPQQGPGRLVPDSGQGLQAGADLTGDLTWGGKDRFYMTSDRTRCGQKGERKVCQIAAITPKWHKMTIYHFFLI